MKDLPPGLPPANSRKWHSRRWWDTLGYLRVRSLANPNWPRDIPWLIKWFQRERTSAPPEDQVRYDQAIAAARAYARAPAGSAEADRAWDQLLLPVDELLAQRQLRHLAAVREAQAEQS